MLVVALVAFSLFKYVGDPVQLMLGQFATPGGPHPPDARLGLDQPFYVQFAHFIVNAVHGEFGLSLRLGEPVSALLARAPARDARAQHLARRCSRWSVGIPMGVYTALRPQLVARATAADAVAPRRVAADVPDRHPADPRLRREARLAAGVRARRRGAARLVDDGIPDASAACRSLILPAITLGLFQLTLIMRLVRAEMLEVLRTDYIKFARARGLSRPRRQLRPRAEEHAGAGHHHHRAAARRRSSRSRSSPRRCSSGPAWGCCSSRRSARRHPGDGGVPVLIALVFVTINLIVDLLYYVVDPRLRVDRPGSAGR